MLAHFTRLCNSICNQVYSQPASAALIPKSLVVPCRLTRCPAAMPWLSKILLNYYSWGEWQIPFFCSAAHVGSDISLMVDRGRQHFKAPRGQETMLTANPHVPFLPQSYLPGYPPSCYFFSPFSWLA